MFDDELDAIVEALAELANYDRIDYRNRNASDIAVTDAARVLVVAGPGAGKSHLFLARIEFWLPSYGDASIYVATFVRKLVRDLPPVARQSDHARLAAGRHPALETTLEEAQSSDWERVSA